MAPGNDIGPRSAGPEIGAEKRGIGSQCQGKAGLQRGNASDRPAGNEFAGYARYIR